MKLYQYDTCSTCKSAIKFLTQHKIQFKKLAIVETPPTKQELDKMLKAHNGELKKLFNTSGQLYREMGMSEKIGSMNSDAAIDLLSKHGKLIKRPFLLGDGVALLGFKEADWKNALHV